MNTQLSNFLVYGAGSWGTALAINFARGNEKAFLLPRRVEHAIEIRQKNENFSYLPNIKLPPNLIILDDFSQIKDQKIDGIIVTIPTQYIRESLTKVSGIINQSIPIIIGAKGIEITTQSLITDVIEQNLPNPTAVLSGPNFAHEVAASLPAAATLASADLALSRSLAKLMRHENFRVYASNDIIGVQIAGAVKNVLAIACGVIYGKKMGNNVVAAFISRGLAEMRRLGIAMGAQDNTFFGLAGVGDLTLTCSHTNSRNMSLGVSLGQGVPLAEILSNRKTIAEGVFTAKALYNLMQKFNIHMPLCLAVYKILYAGQPIDEVINQIISCQSEFE